MLLCPWNLPGKGTGVGCYFLLQRIFPTQGSKPGLPHCRQMLYHLSHQGSLQLMAAEPMQGVVGRNRARTGDHQAVHVEGPTSDYGCQDFQLQIILDPCLYFPFICYLHLFSGFCQFIYIYPTSLPKRCHAAHIREHRHPPGGRILPFPSSLCPLSSFYYLIFTDHIFEPTALP